jgi:hypothetical protein
MPRPRIKFAWAEVECDWCEEQGACVEVVSHSLSVAHPFLTWVCCDCVRAAVEELGGAMKASEPREVGNG